MSLTQDVSVYSQDDSRKTPTEEPQKGQTILTRVETVVSLENEWISLKQEVDDSIYKRHVHGNGHQHGFLEQHDERFEKDRLESGFERVV